MTTDLNRPVEGTDNPKDKYKDININRNNDGNSGSPPTDLEKQPGNIPGEDPEDHPAIKTKIQPAKVQGIDANNQPDIVPGEMLEDEKFTEK
jgi:hypothetical protein